MPGIYEPTLLINSDICKRNIRIMNNRVKNWGGQFRPHFKTHQSSVIGNWFKDEGVESITVSSFKMAQYFAKEGWRDVTVALTATILNKDIINSLAANINLNILVEDIDTIKVLEEELLYPVGVYVKIDTGYHRTGIDVNDLSLVKNFLNELKDKKNLIFMGFLTHAGNTYKCLNENEINQVAKQNIDSFLSLKVFLKEDFPLMQLSWGDTPSCSVYENFYGIDEFRPGNFVFYDYMQSKIGSCKLSDIAVCLAAPVLATHPERNEIVIHAGAIHLSKENITLEDGSVTYGKVVAMKNGKWDVNRDYGEIRSLSQEHGVVSVKYEYSFEIKPGDIVGVLPVHSCLTSNLMKKFLTQEGNFIYMME